VIDDERQVIPCISHGYDVGFDPVIAAGPSGDFAAERVAPEETKTIRGSRIDRAVVGDEVVAAPSDRARELEPRFDTEVVGGGRIGSGLLIIVGATSDAAHRECAAGVERGAGGDVGRISFGGTDPRKIVSIAAAVDGREISSIPRGRARVIFAKV